MNLPLQTYSGIYHQLDTSLGHQLDPDGPTNTTRSNLNSGSIDEDLFAHISNHDPNERSDENGVATKK